MLFVDVAGKVGAVLFWHSGPITAKLGVVCGFTVIFIVAVVAHCPEFGVKVYEFVPAVEVLIVDGLQLPLIALVEVAGNVGAAAFWHNGPMAVNTGDIPEEIVTEVDV